jgi:hypothetical protein
LQIQLWLAGEETNNTANGFLLSDLGKKATFTGHLFDKVSGFLNDTRFSPLGL